MATDPIVYARYKHMGLPHDFAVALAGGTGSTELKAALVALLAEAMTLASLSDVTITSATDGQPLRWDTTTSKWINET